MLFVSAACAAKLAAAVEEGGSPLKGKGIPKPGMKPFSIVAGPPRPLSMLARLLEEFFSKKRPYFTAFPLALALLLR